VARQIKAGQVYINAYGAGGGIELPFRDTPIIRAVSDPAQTGHYRPSGASPLGRVALPDDVPSVVCMLPGEDAR
jgi:hypothetical protein